MNSIQRVFLTALCAVTLSVAACADRQATGPMVTLYEGEKIRQVPAGDFNEAAYLKRGYLKNTDARGNTIYVFSPSRTTRSNRPSGAWTFLTPTTTATPPTGAEEALTPVWAPATTGASEIGPFWRDTASGRFFLRGGAGPKRPAPRRKNRPSLSHAKLDGSRTPLELGERRARV